jgi:penicillin amidase
MIRDAVRRTGLELQRHYPGRNLAQLTWGETNPISLHHPFSGISAILAPLLDMPTFASDGCSSLCVKTMGNSHGASERLILAPAYPENAIFHMPGGQSGHALSRHYRDQQPFWQNAIASPLLLPSPPAYTLRFTP